MDRMRKLIITFILLPIITFTSLLATEAEKETIVKDGVTYTLKQRNEFKKKLMNKVYIKGKKKYLKLEDNKWVLEDKKE